MSQLEKEKTKVEKSFSARIHQKIYEEMEKFSVLSKTQQHKLISSLNKVQQWLST